MFHHKYSLTEVENMLPWERDSYLKLITDYIQAENDKISEEQLKAVKGMG